MIQIAKLVSSMILVLIVEIGTLQFANCQTEEVLQPKQEFSAQIEMPLPYFDPLLADFIYLDKDQAARFTEIKLKWQKEYRGLMLNKPLAGR